MDCEKLQEKLDRSASFRKREITNLSLQIQSVEGEVQKSILRASILIMYAHFEGFSKEAIKLFIKHLNSQNIVVSSMEHHWQTLFHTKKILLIKSSSKKQKFNELLEDILIENGEHFFVNEDAKDIVSSGSNLNFEMLEDLLFIIGAKPDQFELYYDEESSFIHTKKEFIDRELLGRRNAIAHGEGIPVLIREFEEVKKFVISYIDSLKDFILRTSQERSYIKQS
ncbi:MAE_28990/MAE_18760 family HEPN-like nuclease [Exiguobacterium acetylicum]|uniref:MAE_28990/MAE_18760 family HEPN-like nuclease n=1 Tax=Exiguobacterium acetylicum TaxID=41170 RepID=UPI003876C751